MYKRIKTNLFSPSKMIEFINDKWTYIWLYFFMLVIISLLPVLLIHTTSTGFNPYQYKNLDHFVKNDLQVSAKIENYELTIENSYKSRFDRFDFIITNQDLSMDLSSAHMIVMTKTEIKYIFNQIEVRSNTYQELNLETYDFTDRSGENQRLLVNILDNYYELNKASVNAFIIAEEGLGIAIDILLLILIISFFNMKPVPFKFKFKMNVYASTIFVLLNLFSMLTQTALLYYVGIILMFVFSNKAFKRVISIR